MEQVSGKKVYIVTEGVYSDYHIVAVFSDKKLAENFVAKYKGSKRYDEVRIEEYNLDVPPEKWDWIFVRMDREGNVLEYWSEVSTEPLEPNPSKPEFDIEGNLILYVNTDSVEKAVKVANEVRARLLSMDLWGRRTNREVVE